MKINLDELKWLYEDVKDDIDEDENIEDFDDFKEYIIGTIISNIEYDLGVNFSDYVDLNRFIEGDR